MISGPNEHAFNPIGASQQINVFDEHKTSSTTKPVNPKTDSAEISDAGRAALQSDEEQNPEQKQSQIQELSPEDQKVVDQLKQRDRAVRQHEQAHKAVAGSYAIGGPSYTYQTGPDGHRYAIGGHVNIDAGPEAEPEATIRKMDVVRRAALAPAEPSAQDRSVAAQASQQKNQAIQELQNIQQEELKRKIDSHEETAEGQSSNTTAEGETIDSFEAQA